MEGSTASRKRHLEDDEVREKESTGEKRSRSKSNDDDDDAGCVELEVQPFEWKTDPLSAVARERDPMVVRCWCKTEDGRVNLLLFRYFPCTAYLEFPQKSMDGRTLAWNKLQLDTAKAFISDTLAEKFNLRGIELVMKKKLYYANTPSVKMMRLRFDNERNMKDFCREIRKPAIM